MAGQVRRQQKQKDDTWKWLAGAFGAAVVVGGSVWAWTVIQRNQALAAKIRGVVGKLNEEHTREWIKLGIDALKAVVHPSLHTILQVVIDVEQIAVERLAAGQQMSGDQKLALAIQRVRNTA